MRVIAGSARRLQLRTIEGTDTRPTTDRIKETLFNILQPDIPGCLFLDLFAGSGGIGIEALSRGAKRAVFVEKNRRACDCIRLNLEKTRLADQASVIQSDTARALERLREPGHFDIIFMDPPYGQGLELEALRILYGSRILGPDTLVIVETSIQTDPSPMEALGFELCRRKEYKTNMHLFFRRKELSMTQKVSEMSSAGA